MIFFSHLHHLSCLVHVSQVAAPDEVPSSRLLCLPVYLCSPPCADTDGWGYVKNTQMAFRNNMSHISVGCVTVRSRVVHLLLVCDSEGSLAKSRRTGNTLSLKLFSCLTFRPPGAKLVSCVFSLNTETLRGGYLMGLKKKKVPGNEVIYLKDALLISALIVLVRVCVFR